MIPANNGPAAAAAGVGVRARTVRRAARARRQKLTSRRRFARAPPRGRFGARGGESMRNGAPRHSCCRVGVAAVAGPRGPISPPPPPPPGRPLNPAREPRGSTAAAKFTSARRTPRISLLLLLLRFARSAADISRKSLQHVNSYTRCLRTPKFITENTWRRLYDVIPRRRRVNYARHAPPVIASRVFGVFLRSEFAVR